MQESETQALALNLRLRLARHGVRSGGCRDLGLVGLGGVQLTVCSSCYSIVETFAVLSDISLLKKIQAPTVYAGGGPKSAPLQT